MRSTGGVFQALDVAGVMTFWSDLVMNNFYLIDLIAVASNAFNGALLARRKDHDRGYTIVGILLLAVAAGIGGGVARDLILNQPPTDFLNATYIAISLAMGFIALTVAVQAKSRTSARVRLVVSAFALPWYAAIGVYAGLQYGLPYIPAIAIGVISATTGRFIVDLISGVTPLQFVRGEWFVGTAVLTSVVFLIAFELGLSEWPATGLAVLTGFVFRILALVYVWEEPPATEVDVRAASQAPVRSLTQMIKNGFARRRVDSKAAREGAVLDQ